MFTSIIAKSLHYVPFIVLLIFLTIGLILWIQSENQSITSEINEQQIKDLQNKTIFGLAGDTLHYTIKKNSLLTNTPIFYNLYADHAYTHKVDVDIVYMNIVYMVKSSEDQLSYLWADHAKFNKGKNIFDLHTHVLYKVTKSDFYSKVAHYDMNNDIVNGKSLLMVKNNGDQLLSDNYKYNSNTQVLHVKDNISGFFLNQVQEQTSTKKNEHLKK